MSQDSLDGHESSKKQMLELAFRDAVAAQADDPRWLPPGETVIVLSEKVAFEFVGLDEQDMAVCRRPNPEFATAENKVGLSEFIEIRLPQDKVANSTLLAGFYTLYRKEGTYIDPVKLAESINKTE